MRVKWNNFHSVLHNLENQENCQAFFFSSNHFRVKFFQKIELTEFLRQNGGSKISLFPHCGLGILREIATTFEFF